MRADQRNTAGQDHHAPLSEGQTPPPATSEITSLLANWNLASLETSLPELDKAIYKYIKEFDVLEPQYIRDEEYLHLVAMKACREIDKIFSGHRGWKNMTFSVRTYFMVYATEIKVRELTRVNFLLSLHPEDLNNVVELLRFFIEIKRIENGAGRANYQVR